MEGRSVLLTPPSSISEAKRAKTLTSKYSTAQPSVKKSQGIASPASSYVAKRFTDAAVVASVSSKQDGLHNKVGNATRSESRTLVKRTKAPAAVVVGAIFLVCMTLLLAMAGCRKIYHNNM